MAKVENIVIEQGKTLSQVVRWESQPIVYKPITVITQAAPVRITATAHGLPDGWRVAVVSVKGMTQINAASTPPKDKDYHQATVIDANIVELNDVNAADFKPYVSGGYLQFNSPVDLTGFTARLTIKDKVGGTELFKLLTTPGLSDGTITLDIVESSITLTVSATLTAALTWKKGVYDLELESATGEVTALLTGTVTVTKEVTT